MLNPVQIEELYKEFTSNLPQWVHDGVIPINLNFLHDQGLLSSFNDSENDSGGADDLSQYFHVIESVEKVTLFNEQFIVWIIPRMSGEQPTTHVMIALNHSGKVHPEIIFATNGVYNTPRYVLKILQHFLADTLETEKTLTSFEKNA